MGKEHVSPELVLNLASLGILAIALLTGFSMETRNKIRDRARAKLGYLGSEKSGRRDEPLQCSHINHSKDFEGYDTPENGVLLTISEHLQEHIKTAGKNGLSKENNDHAIASLRQQIHIFYKQKDKLRQQTVRA